MKDLSGITMPGDIDASQDMKDLSGITMGTPKPAVRGAPAPKPLLNYRKPTKDEELQGWRDFAWALNLQRAYVGNPNAVEFLLNKLDAYVGAHARRQNTDEKELQAIVSRAFWENIAKDSTIGLKK